jgi:hypothetical protein
VSVPATQPVTETANLQRDPAAIVAPASLIVLGLVTVRVPPQTVAVLLMTRRPAGRMFSKPTPVRAIGFDSGFSMMNPRLTVEPSRTISELNSALIVGGAAVNAGSATGDPAASATTGRASIAIPARATDAIFHMASARTAAERRSR